MIVGLQISQLQGEMEDLQLGHCILRNRSFAELLRIRLWPLCGLHPSQSQLRRTLANSALAALRSGVFDPTLRAGQLGER